VLMWMQKEASNLKVENRNLKRLLLRQGGSGCDECRVRDGVWNSVSFHEQAPPSIHAPDFSFSSADSSTSSCDFPATKLSFKFSLTDLNSLGQSFTQ